MNGIIHTCAKMEGEEDVVISEEKMFSSMFSYIEKLFSIIKPKKVFYLAIDGSFLFFSFSFLSFLFKMELIYFILLQ